MNIKNKNLLIFSALLLIVFTLIFLSKFLKFKAYSNNTSTIYLIYSPTCPHCHHLKEFLKTKSLTNVSIIESTDAMKAYYCLKEKNFDWNFGVPILFAYSNGKLIVIQGYPSSLQDVNGYFGGKDVEEKYCKDMNGKPVYDENKNYLYCVMNNIILGNKYSVEYLIDLCEKNFCEKFCSL